MGLRVALFFFALLLSAHVAAAAVRLPGIRSPSGNIRCLFVPGSGGPDNLLCNIARSDYGAKLQARCIAPPTSLDWHGFELGAAGKGSIVCSGGILYNPDTQRPAYMTLPYGKAWKHGVFVCESRITGVTCTNAKGHGLFISRASWRAW